MRILLALLLTMVCARAGLLNSCSLNAPIKVVVTDASVTPTTNQTAVTGGQNGLRIWTGEQPLTEPYCDVYVSKNGGAVTKLRTFRWGGRILVGSPGDNFSLGTSDGRTFSVTPMWGPTTVETITGTTGTANCDKAGPPIWSPSGAHIILPYNAHSFQVNSDGTERAVFVKEYDGNNWTPTRWFKLEATRATTIRTSYRQIALANYAGVTLSVTAPLGAIIGGTSTPMSLTFPAITGTSRSVTNVTTFMTAVNAAVAGDEIVFSDGTYALTNNLNHNSFASNEVAGNRGFEGITFRSASGIRTNVIISRAVDTNGGWIMDQRFNTGKTTYFKDLTFDETCSANTDATAYGLRWGDGNITMQNVRVTGINLKDTDGEAVLYFQNLSNADTSNIYLLNCQFDNQSGRMLNFSGFQSVGSSNPGTRQVISTDVFTGGTTAAYHLMFAQYDITVGFYGGSVYDAQQYCSSASQNAFLGFYFTSFPQAGTTARSKNQILGSTMFGCDWTSYAGNLTPTPAGNPTMLESYVYFNKFTQSNSGSGSFNPIGPTISNLTVYANFFNMAVGKGLTESAGGGTFAFNIITNASFGVQGFNYTGTGTSQFYCLGNTIDHCTTAIYSTNNAYTSSFTNNATSTSTAGFTTTATGMAAITGNYNVFDPTTTGYVAGLNDLTNVNAAFSVNYFPTASGNCDGNGDPSVVDYVGSSDVYGLVLIYAPTRISRGAREIPGVYTNAVLYPDLW